MFYLIRNPITGGWVNTWFNASETDDPQKAAAKFGSALSARQTMRNLLRKNKERNKAVADGSPAPERYEVVEFQLVQVRVVISE